ncbi:hypothetical protein [Maledivibacter halophilus]|uniref:Uncharacterized protein n=1 Tax=Maledivibacter halophilus TaxID=36842 RepID=A0A1T5L2G3_9FIRM|nr:hypothetical protein [Maledivibacter halophilus]SKC70217.1 hypothetical protein SAMN02194393_02398 [Maledivibacter halophilus]
MFFKKKKKASKKGNQEPKEKELSDIFEEKSKKSDKLENVSDELIAKAIKDLLGKD